MTYSHDSHTQTLTSISTVPRPTPNPILASPIPPPPPQPIPNPIFAPEPTPSRRRLIPPSEGLFIPVCVVVPNAEPKPLPSHSRELPPRTRQFALNIPSSGHTLPSTLDAQCRVRQPAAQALRDAETAYNHNHGYTHSHPSPREEVDEEVTAYPQETLTSEKTPSYATYDLDAIEEQQRLAREAVPEMRRGVKRTFGAMVGEAGGHELGVGGMDVNSQGAAEDGISPESFPFE